MNIAERWLFRFNDYCFGYPAVEEDVLKGIDWSLHQGESVLLTGATGSGKSTLLKLLAGALPGSSHVRIRGSLGWAANIPRRGLVQQSPDDQLFALNAFEELAFGLRNFGVSEAELQRSIPAMLEAVGLSSQAQAAPDRLSGGQKQRLALATALSLQPHLLLLDEPLAQLDPLGVRQILALLRSLQTQDGWALVLAEHRLGEVLESGVVGRLVSLAHGAVVIDDALAPYVEPYDTPALALYRRLDALGLRIPVQAALEIKLTDKVVTATSESAETFNEPAGACGTLLLEVSGITFGYGATVPLLQEFDLAIYRGERIAVLGANGSGKSTLLHLLAGLLKPQAGTIRRETQAGMLFQNPDLMLIGATALDEVSISLRLRRDKVRSRAGVLETQAGALLKLLGLAAHAAGAPLSLSRGQRLRLALAAVLALETELVLLDEPTMGQDRTQMEALLEVIEKRNRTVVFSTHDVDLAYAWATRVVVLENGKIVAQGSPESVFLRAALLARCGLVQPGLLRWTQRHNAPALRSEEACRRWWYCMKLTTGVI